MDSTMASTSCYLRWVLSIPGGKTAEFWPFPYQQKYSLCDMVLGSRLPTFSIYCKGWSWTNAIVDIPISLRILICKVGHILGSLDIPTFTIKKSLINVGKYILFPWIPIGKCHGGISIVSKEIWPWNGASSTYVATVWLQVLSLKRQV